MDADHAKHPLNAWRVRSLIIAFGGVAGLVCRQIVLHFNLLPFFAWVEKLFKAFALAKVIFKILPFLSFLENAQSTWESLRNSPTWLWIVSSGILALLAKRPIGFLHEYIFPGADRSILIPFPKLLAFDPLWGGIKDDPELPEELALAWELPERTSGKPAVGTRLDAWDRLWDFAQRQTGSGKFHFNLFNPLSWHKLGKPSELNFKPFLWTFIVGQPGAGKTRLAVEFLTRELARHEEPETRPSINDKGWIRARRRWKQAWLRYWMGLGEWWRRIWPGLQRKIGDIQNGIKGDPWDIGWIRHETEDNSADRYWNRKRLTSLKTPLGAWNPRRPTALLLDDPLNSDAIGVIETLLSSKNNYRYPVRLFITNQTLPAELSFEFRDDGWHSEFQDFGGEVIRLAEESRLNCSEVLSLARTMPPPLNIWKEGDPGLLRLMEITDEGNPLLVELAFRYFAAHGSLDGVSAEDLVAHRARRIISGIRRSFPDAENAVYQLIAAATLAGPNSKDLIPGSAAKNQWDMLKKTHADHLRACFSLNSAGRHEDLPAVRPERVGYAFVRQIISGELCPSQEDVSRVISTAWQMSRKGVLKAVERAGARSDALGTLLRSDPPEDISVDAPAAAEAYTWAATHFLRGQPRPTSYSEKALEKALDWMNRIESGELETTTKAFSVMPICSPLHEFIDSEAYSMIAVLSTAWIIDQNFNDMNTSHLISLKTIFGQAKVSIQKSLFLRDWVKQATEHLLKISTWALRNEPAHGETDVNILLRVQILAQLTIIVSNSREVKVCQQLTKRIEQLAETYVDSPEFALPRVWGLQGLARAQAMTGSAQECRQTLGRIHRFAWTFRKEETFRIEYARSWRYLSIAYAKINDTKRCRSAVRVVNHLLRPIAVNREIELEKCRSWSLLARVYSGNANFQGCASIILEIDSMSQRFSLERDFECLRAGARSSLAAAYANANNCDGCSDAVIEIDQISRLFAGDRDFEMQRTEAWLSLAQARSSAKDCEGCAAAVTEIHQISEVFSGERDFVLLRALAWMALSNAHSEIADCDGCAAAVLSVDRISQPFAGVRDFEELRARSWQILAHTYSNTKNSDACVNAVAEVDRIASVFAGDPDFEFLRAAAWRCSAYAYLAVRNLSACVKAAAEVDQIAALFEGERDFELLRSRAWQLAGEAHAGLNDWDTCLMANAKVDQICRAFAMDRDFEIQRASAFRCCAGAYYKMQNWDACYQACIEVNRISGQFPQDLEFFFENARALVWSAMIHARVKQQEMCRTAINEVDRIADLFPANYNFQYVRALAWSYLTGILAEAGDYGACSDAITKINKVSEPYQGDHDFELIESALWSDLALAYATANDLERCSNAVSEVKSIAQSYAGDRDFKYQMVKAQNHLLWLYAKRSAMSNCAEVLADIDRLSDFFNQDYDFTLERARAWSYWAQCNIMANNLVGYTVAASKFEQIAEPFVGDRDFDFEHIGMLSVRINLNAIRVEVFSTEACSEDIIKLDNIAKKYVNDTSFSMLRVKAWGHCAVAYAKAHDVEECLRAIGEVDRIVELFDEEVEFRKEQVNCHRQFVELLGKEKLTQTYSQEIENVLAIAKRYGSSA